MYFFLYNIYIYKFEIKIFIFLIYKKKKNKIQYIYILYYHNIQYVNNNQDNHFHSRSIFITISYAIYLKKSIKIKKGDNKYKINKLIFLMWYIFLRKNVLYLTSLRKNNIFIIIMIYTN